MRVNSPMQKGLERSWARIAMLSLTAAIVALVCLTSNEGSHAQQEPNRQLVQPGSTNAKTGKRLALVIGNGAYTSAPPLKNPPNDARDMAATLRALGFEVTNGINVNQRDMKRLIREFGQKLKNGGSGLFYYAGHGVQSRGRNYLIPVDADIQSEAEVEDSAVDASLVLSYMDDAQNGLNIVILDACRNNPFARSFRSASDGLAQVDAPTGTLIAYATAPGRVASDGTGQNGLYTSELLKQMRMPGLSATEMFMRVRAEVMRQTANKQVPWESSSLVGNFYFAAPKTTDTNATGNNSGAESRMAVDTAAFELSYWETIKNSSNADDFKAYLEKYPNGQFGALAKNRIASLDPSTKPAESKPAPTDSSATELAFWDSVKNSNRVGDFQAYLKRYPNGAFTDLASNRIAELENAARERETSGAVKKNSLEGTTWKGDSSGGDKHYEFQFLPNGQVIWNVKMAELVTSKGTWRQTGNTINMDFPDYYPVEATISGNTLTGSWNKGRYKFTVEKTSTAGSTDPSNSTAGPAKRKAVQNKYGIEMVYIPPGRFMMGSNSSDREQPVHEVTITQAFYMGKYEVTQAQWQTVMGNNPSLFKGANLPVEQVSWDDANAFISRLNAQNDGYTYRLPTEAEWEYACRAGTSGDYAGDLDAMAWYGNNSGRGRLDAAEIMRTDAANYQKRIKENGGQTHPVGNKLPNAFGLFDMHGNVWEWCEDWYHPNYEGAPTDGRAWLSGGELRFRVLRAGSWQDDAALVRSAYRYGIVPNFGLNSGLGLRVVAVARTQ